jgi:hypothetical protein
MDPIACTLNETEFQKRRQTILRLIGGAALKVAPLPMGRAFHFEPTSEILSQLVSLVDLERRCCPFLTFRIVVEPANRPICLEVTGPAEAQSMIADLFGS